MRMVKVTVFLLAATLHPHADSLMVGSGQAYTDVQAAATAAQPGDRIIVTDGTYAGGQWLENLHGSAGAWIDIEAAEGASPVWEGGSEAWHLSDPAYVRITGMIFQSQTGNGVNVDDGGSYDTPAHHVAFERCTFRRMNATGNNDLLKLSGLDSFEVRDCVFEDGAEGGSGADMVGCHDGLFTGNRFSRMGSNAIQAKGGTRDIIIERNYFEECGARTLNLGGSTGLAYFRPDTARYEAASLHVYANVIVGSEAPVAFVGSVDVDVVNNTLFKPGRWVVRILQETVDSARFVKCGNGTFANNIVYRTGLSTDCNVGPYTDPGSFTFSNNLWYDFVNPGAGAPRDLPVAEQNGVSGQDPEFADTAARDFSITPASPAAQAGLTVSVPQTDFEGNEYAAQRSIGAYEANSTVARAPATVRRPGRGTVDAPPVRCDLAGRIIVRHGRTWRILDIDGRHFRVR